MNARKPAALSAAALLAVLGTAGFDADAAVIVAQYDFAGGTSTASIDTDTDSVANDIVISGSTSFELTNTRGGQAFIRANRTDSTLGGAVALGAYLSFTVTPAAGLELDFTQLSFANNFSTAVAGATATWALFTSLTGFDTADVIAQVASNVASGDVLSPLAPPIDLASLPTATGPVEFRIFVFDNQNSSGIVARIDDITLSANIVPEPASAALAALGGVLVLRRRR
jgi:hypothetical protein